MLVRQVQLARDVGALDQLPILLGALGMAVTWSGDFAAAASLIAEADAVCEATGSRAAPFTAMMLASPARQPGRGRPADRGHHRRGHSRGPGHRGDLRALGGRDPGQRPRPLRRRAGGGPASQRGHPTLYISMWALPELIEAAARSGNTRARRPMRSTGWRRPTQAGGTDFGLGIQARSRALLSEGEAAEGLYREAIDRLGRTQLRPELARAHLLYGEWLRRENRRADARAQLRTAYDMLAAIGMEAFAERARRELLATGETVRKRTLATRHQAHRAGGAHRPAGRGRPDQPGDRRPAVPQRPHRRMAPAQGVHQARYRLPPRAAPGPGRSTCPASPPADP